MAESRTEILNRFRRRSPRGKPIIGGGAGTGISAKFEEAGGIDLIVIYNSGRFRMAGHGSLAGLLPFGDANAIVMEMAAEVLPVVKRTPVLAGVCGTDPMRRMERFLAEVKAAGFAGVQNFPTVGLFDGTFRANLEETNMGYGREVEMIRLAREMDLLTTPYVFNPDEAVRMAEAGADILVAHMGLTTAGSIGAKTAKTLAAVRAADRRDGRGRPQGPRATCSSCATAARSPSPRTPPSSSSTARQSTDSTGPAPWSGSPRSGPSASRRRSSLGSAGDDVGQVANLPHRRNRLSKSRGLRKCSGESALYPPLGLGVIIPVKSERGAGWQPAPTGCDFGL